MLVARRQQFPSHFLLHHLLSVIVEVWLESDRKRNVDLETVIDEFLPAAERYNIGNSEDDHSASDDDNLHNEDEIT